MQAHAMHFDVMGDGGHSGKLLVRFNLEPVHNPAKSAEAGHPVYDNVEHVELMVPGDKTTRVHRPVREQDRRDHAGAYAAFKQGMEAPLEGMPLKEWPGCTRGEVEMLAHFRIRTVEELAAINDGNAQQIGPILALRQRARDYLTAAKQAAPADHLRKELAERDAQIQALQQQVRELLEENNRKRKG